MRRSAKQSQQLHSSVCGHDVVGEEKEKKIYLKDLKKEGQGREPLMGKVWDVDEGKGTRGPILLQVW